ncbi:MAG: MBL fold metallo-hydrolase [Desulfobacterales bacterium]|jgi:glyoxylase-like metal-dependent hydrolase (beta-lactamase superfamily II)
MENLWQVGGDHLTASGDAAIYLVRFGDEAALIDAGCGAGHDQLVKNISQCLPAAVRLSYLFLSHCHYDHTGGAEAVRHHYGCKIVAHELDAAFLERGDNTVTAASWYGARLSPLLVDHKIKAESEAIFVGKGMVQAYHCPGHSPGSLVFMVELNTTGVLFGQDIHGPLHPALLSDNRDYVNSLEFILSLEADILCEGHFGVFKGRQQIELFVRSFLD